MMKSQRQSRAFTMVFPVLLVCVFGTGTGWAQSCDWQRGDLHKMHWSQVPDLSPTGMDVSLARTPLADDFRCTATGAIRDIHLWGSFVNDVLPKEGPDSLTLELRIYSDIPAEKDRWSRPGELLWSRIFMPGQYTARKVHDGPEGWYDPIVYLYLPDNHRQAYQYNFCIDEDPFIQQEGTIYWLFVRDLTGSQHYVFGWKTTSKRFHWNDDAVYYHSDDRGWVEMIYPKEHEYGGETLDLAFVITSGDEAPPEHDLGDAPDSSNSLSTAGMLAYPSGVMGRFPTVYQVGSPPHGPLHLYPRDRFHLGRWVSLESEADLGPDEDVLNNLDPLNDSSNRDGADDGLRLPVIMPPCQQTTLDYVVTTMGLLTDRVYVNVWCDWNRDGDWNDTMVCADGTTVPEWAVQNHQPSIPGPGTQTLTTPPFTCWHPTAGDDIEALWVRITVAEQPASTSATGGAGPQGGYLYGETEDYYIKPQTNVAPARYDWGDAPDDATAAGYPTRLASNGARHVIAGPWLGDENDRPDPESDGQPDLYALGDNNAGSNDENGVSIPPLVQGQPQSATVRIMGGGGVVQAWIDFDGDRIWQDSERIFNGFLPDGIHVIPFNVPEEVVQGQSFARVRISRRGGLEPYGVAADGEVEDYEVSIRLLPTEMKWCQWPDLTPHGIDIRVDRSDNLQRIVADDFPCEQRGLLTHVRLWGSWKKDRKGVIKKLRLRIHRDDPPGLQGADKKNLYSKPGPETLWEMEFAPGQYQEKLYHTVAIGGEWWWDLASGIATPNGDTQVWQLDVEIDPSQAFLQTGSPEKPAIYWLAVETETVEGQFGWKTRHWPEHFMDDAVWTIDEVSPPVWTEMFYPKGHRFHDHEKNSVDMAFCLLFAPDDPQPATYQPVSVTTCPPVETTCPAVLTTCPAIATRCPGEATRCPVTQTACPPMQTLCPAVETKCPGGVTQCPPTETQCPTTETQCPAMATTCPPVSTRCPAAQTSCPVMATKCPPTATQCPPAVTKCPATSTQCPVTETQCPSMPTTCPPVQTRCPATETVCPSVETQCPPAETKCPPTATECQVAATQCPAVETRCPPTSTKCPPFTTRCPATETQCPATITKCPPVVTKCPAVSTKCPLMKTRCPVEATACPAEVTRCPPVETQCPPALTKCASCPPIIILGQDATGTTSVGACPVIEARCPTVKDYVAVAKVGK